MPQPYQQDERVYARALTELNLSNCTRLSPRFLAAALRGAPVLESLNLTGCADCLTDDAVESFVAALEAAAAPPSGTGEPPLRHLRLSRALGSTPSGKHAAPLTGARR